MHIALFSPAWPLGANPNGIVTYTHWLALAMQHMGHKVTVFTPHLKGNDLTIDAYQIHENLGFKLAQRILSKLQPNIHGVLRYGKAIGACIKHVHKQHPIDIIEMEESFGWCADVQKTCGIPVVSKLHGPAFLSLVEEELASDFAQAKIAAEGEALQKVAAITSPCQHVKIETAKRFSLNVHDIAHIENPISMLDDRSKLWKQENTAPGTILFVGRFDKRKGGDIALLAFEHVLKHVSNANLIFIGPDYGLSNDRGLPIKYAEYINEYLQKETSLKVRFLGSQQRSTIEALRLEANVVFTASRWENQSYTGLEAMRQGCPLICVDSGGQAEIIKDGETGLIASAHNHIDLAEKIVYLLKNPKYSANLGISAKDYVDEIHSPERIAKLTLDIYTQVLS